MLDSEASTAPGCWMLDSEASRILDIGFQKPPDLLFWFGVLNIGFKLSWDIGHWSQIALGVRTLDVGFRKPLDVIVGC